MFVIKQMQFCYIRSFVCTTTNVFHGTVYHQLVLKVDCPLRRLNCQGKRQIPTPMDKDSSGVRKYNTGSISNSIFFCNATCVALVILLRFISEGYLDVILRNQNPEHHRGMNSGSQYHPSLNRSLLVSGEIEVLILRFESKGLTLLKVVSRRLPSVKQHPEKA